MFRVFCGRGLGVSGRALVCCLSLVLLTSSACSSEEEVSSGNGSWELAEGPIFNNSWIVRQMYAFVLDRMFVEHGSDEVLDGFEKERDGLVDVGVLVDEGGDGFRVVLDMRDWDEKSRTSKDFDGPLRVILMNNEVDWCGDPVAGHRFAYDYNNKFNDAFDTEEEYHASMKDYVDCGDGYL